MTAAQVAKNYGDEWGLSWFLRWGSFTSVPAWTHSQSLLAAAEAQNLKTSPHETSLKWSRRPSQLTQE